MHPVFVIRGLPVTETETTYKIRPKKPSWTHLALCVSDIEASIAWYLKHTHLEVLARNEDPNGHGVWMGDPGDADSPFILVMAEFYEGKDPFAPAVHSPIGPFAHIGIEMPEREMIDEIAALGKEGDCLAFGPTEMPPPIGYICFLKDPDGNTVEFSFDQGVYEKAREVWGKNDTA